MGIWGRVLSPNPLLFVNQTNGISQCLKMFIVAVIRGFNPSRNGAMPSLASPAMAGYFNDDARDGIAPRLSVLGPTKPEQTQDVINHEPLAGRVSVLGRIRSRKVSDGGNASSMLT